MHRASMTSSDWHTVPLHSMQLLPLLSPTLSDTPATRAARSFPPHPARIRSTLSPMLLPSNMQLLLSTALLRSKETHL